MASSTVDLNVIFIPLYKHEYIIHNGKSVMSAQWCGVVWSGV